MDEFDRGRFHPFTRPPRESPASYRLPEAPAPGETTVTIAPAGRSTWTLDGSDREERARWRARAPPGRPGSPPGDSRWRMDARVRHGTGRGTAGAHLCEGPAKPDRAQRTRTRPRTGCEHGSAGASAPPWPGRPAPPGPHGRTRAGCATGSGVQWRSRTCTGRRRARTPRAGPRPARAARSRSPAAGADATAGSPRTCAARAGRSGHPVRGRTPRPAHRRGPSSRAAPGRNAASRTCPATR